MKHLQTFENFSQEITESEYALNESIVKLDPALEKEVKGILDPLIKAYKMDIKSMDLEIRGGNANLTLSIDVWAVITGGSWVSAKFFNQKDAEKVEALFKNIEMNSIQSPGGTIVRKDSFGSYLRIPDLEKLANLKGIKINFLKLQELLNNSI